MIEGLIASIISQIKNPWQYICVGLIGFGLWYYKVDMGIHSIFLLMVAMGGASIIEKIADWLKKQIKTYIIKKQMLDFLLNLSDREKDIIRTFFLNKTDTMDLQTTVWQSVMTSLEAKRIIIRTGHNNLAIDNGGIVCPIVLTPVAKKLIKKHHKEIFKLNKKLPKRPFALVRWVKKLIKPLENR